MSTLITNFNTKNSNCDTKINNRKRLMMLGGSIVHLEREKTLPFPYI